MKKISAIGLMSGTSVDGLDVCLAQYIYEKNQWNFDIIRTKTYDFPSELKLKLKNCTEISGLELTKLDNEFGVFCGIKINEFIDEFNINKDEISLVASHGHTVFHQPHHKFTLQIGCGKQMAQNCGLTVINDFRKTDVILGGQGAPLVPIGDKLLFSEYEACINLGGFSNISFDNNEMRIAFDICPVNIVLNYLCEQLHLPFDDGGEIAKNSNIDYELLTLLNNNVYYKKTFPKSLGIEWVKKNIFPFLDLSKPKSNIATLTEHAAIQISSVLNKYVLKKVLFTGGGTYNTYLIDRINHYYKGKIIIPNKEIINNKESLIFGFLGVLKYLNLPNILSSYS